MGALKRELKDSGLPAAIQTLTRDMVDRARTNALLNEADGIIRQLRQISSAQECVLSLYSPSSFDLILADEGSLKQGEARMTTMPLKEAIMRSATNYRQCSIFGMERRIHKFKRVTC